MRKLINGIPARERAGLNAYSFIQAGAQFHHNSKICLSELRRITCPEEINYYIFPAVGYRRIQDRFIKWVMQESSWRLAFGKDQTNDLILDGVDIDLQQQKSYCISAMIALRFSWEFPFQLGLWDLLVRIGVKEGLAHLIASFYRETDIRTFTFQNVAGAHGNFRHLDDKVAKEYLLNKIPKQLDTEPESFYKANEWYNVYDVLFKGFNSSGDKLDCSLQLPQSYGWKNDPINGELFYQKVLEYQQELLK